MSAGPVASQAVQSRAPNTPERPRFQSWRALRDAQLVRQKRDFSCGLASLATLLTYYFRDRVSEDALLAQLLAQDSAAAPLQHEARGVTLADLARLARARGYRAAGLRVSPEALGRLTRPVLLSLNFRGLGHFSVLRGIDARGHVWLADPSWGNRQFSRAEFRRLFITGKGGRGRILLLGQAADDRKAGRVSAIDGSWFGADLPRPLLEPTALWR